MDQSEQDTVQTGLPAPSARPAPRHAVPAEEPGVPVLVTKIVSIYHGSFKAVTDVSLPVYENQITAFIGSSAAARPRCCARSTG